MMMIMMNDEYRMMMMIMMNDEYRMMMMLVCMPVGI